MKYLSVIILVSLFGASFAFSATQESDAEKILAQIGQTPALVLFYRADCAPCQIEIKMLPRIKNAAGNWPVTIISLSAPDEKLSGKDVNVIDASDMDGKEILSYFNDDNAALPFSFALDGKRSICGKRTGMLGLETIKKWKATCSG